MKYKMINDRLNTIWIRPSTCCVFSHGNGEHIYYRYVDIEDDNHTVVCEDKMMKLLEE